MNNQDPLEMLLVSEKQTVDRSELAQLLIPYVSIHKESSSFEFSGKFLNLPNQEKILLILCAVKARNLILKTEDAISPSEIIKLEIAPEGSIKNTLKTLTDSKEIKSDKGKYSLPNYKLPQVIARLKEITK
jgi:hypothetical protein